MTKTPIKQYTTKFVVKNSPHTQSHPRLLSKETDMMEHKANSEEEKYNRDQQTYAQNDYDH